MNNNQEKNNICSNKCKEAEFGHFEIKGMEFQLEETVYVNAQEMRSE